MDFEIGGRQVHFGTGGRALEGSEPLVVLVHGAGMDNTVWQLHSRFLAHHGYRVAAVDLPAHGRSAGPPLESIDAIAAWIWQFGDHIGELRVSLVGHSMGALAALAATAAEPDRVAALVLLGVAATMPVHPDLLDAAERRDPVAYDLITDWAHGPRAHVGGHRAPGLWMTGGARRLLRRDTEGALATDLMVCANYDGAVDAAGKVTAPTTLVLGTRDRMTPPSNAEPLAAALGDVEIATIPDAGHMMMVERPDEVRAALGSGLAR